MHVQQALPGLAPVKRADGSVASSAASGEARAASGEARRNLRLLKWVGIVLPLLFLGGADYLRERLFPGDFAGIGSRVFFFGILAAAVALFSQSIFMLVDRLERRILRQNEHLAVLNTIARASAQSSGLEALLDVSLDEVLAALRADAGLICVVDLAQGEHSVVASRGFSEELIRGLRRAKIHDDPIASEVVRTGCPVVAEKLFDDPRVSETAIREGVRSAISVPLKSHGEITGIMAVASRAERRFEEPEQALLMSVAGQLGMAISQASALERSLRRNQETEALLVVSGAVTSSLDLPDVLDRALETILEVTSAEAAEIWLADDGVLTLTRHRGISPGTPGGMSRVRAGEGLPGLAFATRKPVTIRDVALGERLVPLGLSADGFEAFCALPLLHKETPLGALAVAARAPNALSAPEELRLLAGVSEVISVAIENACLYERVQDTAVLEERERIAREMHDGLAQVLTYVNAQSLAIGRLVATGRPAEAQEELAKMEEAVREVYADVREAILGLRASPRSGEGFFSSLRAYLDAFSEMTGIAAPMRLDGKAESAALPPSTEIQLMRIIQEALANVRKHASAQRATVNFELRGEGLRVTVEDDGRGFDPERLMPRGWPRFGLQTMRERAEAIGGNFEILSSPGGGTSVVIDLAATRNGARAVSA